MSSPDSCFGGFKKAAQHSSEAQTGGNERHGEEGMTQVNALAQQLNGHHSAARSPVCSTSLIGLTGWRNKKSHKTNADHASFNWQRGNRFGRFSLDSLPLLGVPKNTIEAYMIPATQRLEKQGTPLSLSLMATALDIHKITASTCADTGCIP